MKKILLIIVLAFLLGLTACASVGQESSDQSTESIDPHTIVALEVKELPTKTFYAGGMFEGQGLVLVAQMYDGSREIVKSNYEITPLLFESAGTVTMTATYKGAFCTFDVVVKENEVEAFAIVAPPKMEYRVGEAFDSTGMELMVNYANGTRETVSKGFTCEAPEFSAPGKYQVVVSYWDKSDNLYVTVTED